MWFTLIGLLIACNDKDDSDTGLVEDTEDTEDSDTEDTDETDTEDSDTEDTEGSETDETDEFADSAFPELLADFTEQIEVAIPYPLIGEEDPENITPSILLVLGFGPMLELQMIMDSSTEEVTCPEIQGEFPEEGLPTEDIVVTGNGCTNEFGTTYEGSFIYGPNGLTYSDYIVRPEVQSCGVQSMNHYNGGVFLGIGITGLDTESLMLIHSETVNEEDCTVESGGFSFHSTMSMMSQQDETQIINGEADLLVESSGIEMTYHLNTVDQVNGEVCDSEPLSGTNTIGNGVDELLFTYDGATDCDGTCDDETFTDKASCEGAGGMWSGTPTQMLSINGGAQYEVEGASCATANSRDTIGWMIGLLGMLSIRRRQN